MSFEIPPTNPIRKDHLTPEGLKNQDKVLFPIQFGDSFFHIPVQREFSDSFNQLCSENSGYTMDEFLNCFNKWKTGLDWQDFRKDIENIKAGYFLLDKFSLIYTQLDAKDRKLLTKASKEFFNHLGFEYFMPRDNKEGDVSNSKKNLEIYLFFFCKLFANKLTLERDVSKKNNEAVQEHINIMDNGIAILASYVQQGWNNNYIRVPPREYLELLITSGIPKEIKACLWELIDKDNWHNLETKGWDLRYQDDKETYALASSYAIVQAKIENDKVIRQLALLETGIKPDTKEKRATWDCPVEHIVEASQDRNTLLLDLHRHSYSRSLEDNELPNSMKFQLNLFEALSRDLKFKNWYIDYDEFDLPDILRFWLNREYKIEYSPQDIKTALQDYLDVKGGVKPPRIRSFIVLPSNVQESREITHALNFWEELWKAKEDTRATVQLFYSRDNSNFVLETAKHSNRKNLFVFSPYEFKEVPTDSKTGFFVQTFAYKNRPDKIYHSKHFSEASLALSYVASEQGRKIGWGEDNSSGIPILGNERLSECLREDHELELAFDSSYKRNSLKRHPEIIVVSNDYDFYDKQPEVEPQFTHTALPVVLK